MAGRLCRNNLDRPGHPRGDPAPEIRHGLGRERLVGGIGAASSSTRPDRLEERGFPRCHPGGPKGRACRPRAGLLGSRGEGRRTPFAARDTGRRSRPGPGGPSTRRSRPRPKRPRPRRPPGIRASKAPRLPRSSARKSSAKGRFRVFEPHGVKHRPGGGDSLKMARPRGCRTNGGTASRRSQATMADRPARVSSAVILDPFVDGEVAHEAQSFPGYRVSRPRCLKKGRRAAPDRFETS